MEMKFEGLQELTRAMQQTESNVEKEKNTALEAGAKVMQKGAQDLVRYRTGNLHDHIEISKVENDQIEIYVDNQGKAYYGQMIELGTSKMRAQPFMGPAFIRDQMKIEQAMAKSLRRSLGLTL